MIGMDYCSCIIHYDFLSTSDKLLTSLREVSLQTLTECKKIRESLGGENHHEEQCNIPTVLNEEPLFHHRECYQKFTYARALLKRKLENENEVTKATNDLRELVLQQVLLAQKSVYFRPNNA